jgi:UDP-N-acetylglucosamine acyltransferase
MSGVRAPQHPPYLVNIHPTAIVSADARLSPGCVIHAHAHVLGGSELGEGVVVHPFAVVGGDPQDLSFDPTISSGVRIGARTVIREHVTISRATHAGQHTLIGPDCFLMAASHVAHDCRIDANVILANAVLLAGHVQVGERAFLGGGAVVHQFCRIGEGAMIGGGARIAGDVPPFCMATERNALIGLNVVGLRRRGFKRPVMTELKQALHILGAPVGNAREQAAALISGGTYHTPEALRFLEFFITGRRPVIRQRRAGRENLGDADG